MIEIEASPNPYVSLEISNDITKRLINSLLFLSDYWAEVVDLKVTEQAKVNINNLSCSSNIFWLFSAINRRLYELTLRKQPQKVKKYIKLLSNFDISDHTTNKIIDLCALPKAQQSLFSYYATEGYPEPQVFLSTDTDGMKTTLKFINGSLQIIKESLPDFYSEIENYVNTFVVFTSDTMSSGSSSHLLKCIYLQTFQNRETTSQLRVLDRIIHECAHMHLHLISIYDPLVLNDPNIKFTSPFRKDLRPMIGVFHAYFVLFRLVIALRNGKLRTYFKEVINELDDMLKRYESAYYTTHKVICDRAEFSDLGIKLFQETEL